jgi:hypothetical protein
MDPRVGERVRDRLRNRAHEIMAELSLDLLQMLRTTNTQKAQNMSQPVEILVHMEIDVDGAPNAYGPRGKPTLDYELSAKSSSGIFQVPTTTTTSSKTRHRLMPRPQRWD